MPSSFLLLLWLRRLVAVVFVGVFALGIGRAATLPFDAPLHIQPDSSSPIVGTLPAGTSITSMVREELAAAGLPQPPSGWIVIRSAGPFSGFVHNQDVAGDGTINPGAVIREQPLADAPKLLDVVEGDTAVAREPLGDWSRATIHTDLLVYVYSVPPVSRSQAATMQDLPPEPSDPMVSSAPPPSNRRVAKPAKPKKVREPKVEPVPVETAGVPRTFVGYLMPTRRFLGRGPKYDFQLVEEDGRRIALLDFSTMGTMATIESFENRRVSVYGPGISRPDVTDLILRVQTLRLER